MRQYFHLQFKLFNRKLMEIGLHPIAGYIFSFLGFSAMSYYLFLKLELAEYIYILIPLILVTKLNSTERNDFIKIIFSTRNYRKLRLIENLLYILPFAIVLIFNSAFISFGVLILLAILMVGGRSANNSNFTFPTPFSKKPFEFSTGFRQKYAFVLLAFIILFSGISVTNFNLAVASILLLALTCMSFYSVPEEDYYVWNFSFSPKQFVLGKIKTAIFHFSLLTLPIVLLLGLIFLEHWKITLVISLLSYAYLAAMVFSKYASYPNEISLPQSILIAVSLMFPPLVIILIVYFYVQSLKQLNYILL